VAAFVGVGAATLGWPCWPARCAGLGQHHHTSDEVAKETKEANLAEWSAPAKGLRSIDVLCGAVLVSTPPAGVSCGSPSWPAGFPVAFGRRMWAGIHPPTRRLFSPVERLTEGPTDRRSLVLSSRNAFGFRIRLAYA